LFCIAKRVCDWAGSHLFRAFVTRMSLRAHGGHLICVVQETTSPKEGRAKSALTKSGSGAGSRKTREELASQFVAGDRGHGKTVIECIAYLGELLPMPVADLPCWVADCPLPAGEMPALKVVQGRVKQHAHNHLCRSMPHSFSLTGSYSSPCPFPEFPADDDPDEAPDYPDGSREATLLKVRLASIHGGSGLLPCSADDLLSLQRACTC
jgi:hypothetical protein